MRAALNVLKVMLVSIWGAAAVLLPGSFMFHLVIYIIEDRGELYFSLANIVYGLVAVIVSASFFYVVLKTKVFEIKK